MMPVADFNDGDELTRERIKSWVRAIRELQSAAILSVQPPLVKSGPTLLARIKDQAIEEWQGKTVTAGPEEETDYADERYWVQRAYCDNDTGDDSERITFTCYTEDDDQFLHITATNLGELLDGSHSLAADTIVHVFTVMDQQSPPVKHYYFVAVGGLPLSWGKAISDWSSGDTVSMHPCDPDGGNEDTETTITGYLICPTGGSPAAANIKAADVLAYLPFGEDEGVIVNADLGGLPPGTATNQMLRWDASEEKWKLLAPPDAAYKVLQRAYDGTLAWDYPKYT